MRVAGKELLQYHFSSVGQLFLIVTQGREKLFLSGRTKQNKRTNSSVVDASRRSYINSYCGKAPKRSPKIEKNISSPLLQAKCKKPNQSYLVNLKALFPLSLCSFVVIECLGHFKAHFIGVFAEAPLLGAISKLEFIYLEPYIKVPKIKSSVRALKRSNKLDYADVGLI